MYKICKQFGFSASHSLNLCDAHPCSRLHGHNYVAELVLQSKQLDDNSMVLDYRELVPFKAIVDQLDHRHLNDALPVEPTAENIARWLFEQATELWGSLVLAVRVSETGKTWAEYARQ